MSISICFQILGYLHLGRSLGYCLDEEYGHAATAMSLSIIFLHLAQ